MRPTVRARGGLVILAVLAGCSIGALTEPTPAAMSNAEVLSGVVIDDDFLVDPRVVGRPGLFSDTEVRAIVESIVTIDASDS